MTKADEAYQKLDIAALKILGIAALFNDEAGDGRRLEPDETNGLYWTLQQIGQEIRENLDLITTVKQPS